jgi:uncharacterized protein (UPF0548 family)
MRVMSAGDGYKYLLRTVATGDGDRCSLDAADELLHGGRHPARRWLGSAVTALGSGSDHCR